jgi:2-haloacid dehalogenase
MVKNTINTIIFDLGGVLVDWQPAKLYRTVFNGDEEKVQWFLNNVCTLSWNMEQDGGRTIAEGTAIKIEQFPAYEKEITLFYEKWTEMFVGPIEKNVKLFQQLKSSGNYKIYALTNWSAEKWDIALTLFPFFNEFDGVIVSGIEKMRKPHPAIYKLLLNRFNITPENAIFIDDNLENVQAANKLKIHAIQFKNHQKLIADLKPHQLIY